jgi:hypothetical protein
MRSASIGLESDYGTNSALNINLQKYLDKGSTEDKRFEGNISALTDMRSPSLKSLNQ